MRIEDLKKEYHPQKTSWLTGRKALVIAFSAVAAVVAYKNRDVVAQLPGAMLETLQEGHYHHRCYHRHYHNHWCND